MACVYENDLLKSEKNIHELLLETISDDSIATAIYFCEQFRMKKRKEKFIDLTNKEPRKKRNTLDC